MLRKTFNQLLDKHFATVAGSDNLGNLEHDVMRRINQIQAENSAQLAKLESWYEKVISMLSVPQFRLVSVAVALVIGIGSSPILALNPHAETSSFQLKAFSYEQYKLSLHLTSKYK